MKESNPIKVAEFACDRGIKMDLPFNGGTLCIGKTRSQNCSCKIHAAKTMHEYGIEVPLTIANVLKKRE